MNKITPEMINLAARYLTYTNNRPKKIKVTHEFYNILTASCHHAYLNINSPEGIRANFVGIPVVIDDTIENEYYELEF